MSPTNRTVSILYDRPDSEKGNVAFRRSLYVVNDIEAGGIFDETNIRSIRPGYGLPPKSLPQVLGKRAAQRLERGTALRWDHVEPE